MSRLKIYSCSKCGETCVLTVTVPSKGEQIPGQIPEICPYFNWTAEENPDWIRLEETI